MVDQDREAPPQPGEDTPPADTTTADSTAADSTAEDAETLEEAAPDAVADIDDESGQAAPAAPSIEPGEASVIDLPAGAEDTSEAEPAADAVPSEDSPDVNEATDEPRDGGSLAEGAPPAGEDSLPTDLVPDASEASNETEASEETEALELTAVAPDADADASASSDATEAALAGPSDEVTPSEADAAPPEPTEALEPAAPAGPLPGHLGALRSSTPVVGRWLRREARPRPPVQNRYTTEAPEWLQPEFEHQSVEVPSPPLGRSPGRLPAVVLAILMSGVFLLFVLIEPTPTWLLLFGAIMAALGTDGVLRSIRHRIFERENGPDSVPHIFLPTLFALAIPLFIEENLESYWVIPAALVAGVTFVLVTLAEVPAAEAEDDEFRGRARFVSVAATYFVGFALFSLTYTFDLPLRDALLVVALVSVLLAVELLREGEIDPLETLLLAAVVGIVVAEARWVLKYMPIDAYPAGLTLVLVFYFATGMVHAYMTRHINVTVAAEYSIVTVLGLALVVAARAIGIA